jgi:hypothetical protein
VLLACAAGLSAVVAQLRCVDAAREIARLVARGEPGAAAPAAGLAPPGAAVQVRRDGGYVVARVVARPPMLAGLVIAGEAVAALEPGRR